LETKTFLTIKNNFMKQQQIASNIRWEKHRANMRELENLRNEVLSLREANEAKSTMLFRTEQLANKYESIIIKKSDEIVGMKRTKRLDDLYILKLERSNKSKNTSLNFLFVITIIGYISLFFAVV
jgi:hypothetical protein